MATEHALHRLAARQHGLASRTQLLRLGYSSHQITGRVARGLWVRAAPSVYDLAPFSREPRRALHAAVLSSGGWASHASAAHLLGFIDDAPVRPVIVVREGRHPRALDVVVHRARGLTARDRTIVDGIACTSPIRTLLGLAATADSAVLDEAVSRALISGRTTVRRLDGLLDRSLAGHPAVTQLRAAVERHRDRSQLTMSLLEAIVARAVRRGGLPAPVHQHAVRVEGRTFRLDLAWPEPRIFVEADGLVFHASRNAFLRDRERQNLLVVAGWIPLRYDWHTAVHDPALILRQIRAKLG